ncbi:unnamed protein product [Urochloa humidicola]
MGAWRRGIEESCPCFLQRTHNLKPANEESIEVGASDQSAWDRTRPNMSSHQRPSSRKDICFCSTSIFCHICFAVPLPQ